MNWWIKTYLINLNTLSYIAGHNEEIGYLHDAELDAKFVIDYKKFTLVYSIQLV